MTNAWTSPCRRCSECRGENHHWLEHCDDPEEVEPFVGYICKHCEARAEMCDACGGAAEPGHACDLGEDGPYVCPGCYAVGGERCLPGCIDDEMRREREEAIASGDYDRMEDREAWADDEEDEPQEVR